MGSLITHIFIQARMSSKRFPGKILAPLYDKPILKHVIDRAKEAKSANRVVVLTSDQLSDDPVVAYMKSIQCDYFRGSLKHVFDRFQSALKVFPCDYFVRISADSPFLNSSLLEYMIQLSKKGNDDIVSNVVIRTFPKGQSVEVAKSEKFLLVDQSMLTREELEEKSEYVFPYFYRNTSCYKIRSVKNMRDESHLNFCVDTVEDLQRLKITETCYQFDREMVC